jgi:ParB family transcriptional regulator, chromosome partitioning protein
MPVELKGLKGLHGLENLLESKTDVINNESMVYLPIEQLVSGQYQPRTHFNEVTLIELANSIQSQGILQPLIVRKLERGQYEIIAGERRARAAQIAGLREVPVVLRDIPDNTALAYALIENIQREDLNPIDQAFSLSRLKDEFLMTHEEVARIVGLSRSSISNLLRLLSLCDAVKNFLREKKIEMGHARALLTLTEQQQMIVAEEIVAKSLSVRETERIVQKINHTKSSPIIDDNLAVKITQWSNALSQYLSSSVKIKLNQKGEGSLMIKITSLQEIEWLIERLRD